MKKLPILCLSALPLLPCLAMAEPETPKIPLSLRGTVPSKDAPQKDGAVTCTYNHKQPNASGTAELTIKNHKVSRIYFKSYYPGGPGELSFVCDIDLNRDDVAYSWQDGKSAIIIKTKETGDTVELNRNKKGYVLSFANLNRLSKYCGAGAQVPDDVFIPHGGKQCKVTMPR